MESTEMPLQPAEEIVQESAPTPPLEEPEGPNPLDFPPLSATVPMKPGGQTGPLPGQTQADTGPLPGQTQADTPAPIEEQKKASTPAETAPTDPSTAGSQKGNTEPMDQGDDSIQFVAEMDSTVAPVEYPELSEEDAYIKKFFPKPELDPNFEPGNFHIDDAIMYLKKGKWIQS